MEQNTKPTWRENRALAALLLCAVVLVSVFGIGSVKVQAVGSKMRTLYADTLQEHYQLRVQAADSIVAIGAQALDIEEAALQQAQQALEQANQAVTPAEQFAANTALQSKIGLLYEETRAVLGDEKGGVLQTQWSEFLSRGNIMGKQAPVYNEEARAAQKKLRGFPAGLLRALNRVDVSEYA